MLKKILFTLVLSLTSLCLFAQEDVTKFLGIPVDGTKAEMKAKLIEKGFTPKKEGNTEFLEGEFNGTDVHIYIATNNNKVCRIMVCDANTVNEAKIRIRFNTLIQQFSNNKRYIFLDENEPIPEDEDISYEMTINNKIYEANFYQADSEALTKKAYETLREKYTDEQLKNPTDEISKEINLTAAIVLADSVKNKPVWFRIEELLGKYYIAIFYDNEKNRANGEDL